MDNIIWQPIHRAAAHRNIQQRAAGVRCGLLRLEYRVFTRLVLATAVYMIFHKKGWSGKSKNVSWASIYIKWFKNTLNIISEYFNYFKKGLEKKVLDVNIYCNLIFFSEPSFFFKLSFFSRLDSDVFDEDGNSLPSLDYDRDQMDVRSPSSIADDLYSLYYPAEKRWLLSPFELRDIHVEHLPSPCSPLCVHVVLCQSMCIVKMSVTIIEIIMILFIYFKLKSTVSVLVNFQGEL